MSSEDISIDVQSISKTYYIYNNPSDRLKQSILPRIQNLIGANQQKYFNEFHALQNISFQVKRGETWGIIGKNGSGKSTLLQVICGTLSPTSGNVSVKGRVAALLELGAGFNPDFTGRENIYLNAGILGLSREKIEERLQDILDFADIGDFINQPVKTYSSGMYVRLAFAVIAHVDADIMVIDEALAVGDIYFVQKCMRFIRKFMETGTVLFVSHDTASISALCDKAIWLENGQVKLLGSQKEIAAAYLADYYASLRNEPITEPSQDNILPDEKSASQIQEQERDMRLDFINQSNLRNDLEIFTFGDSATPFGVGGGSVLNAALIDDHGSRFNWIVGGEIINLVITTLAHTPIKNPVIGFVIKNRLGQPIFGDNTFLTFQNKDMSMNTNETFKTTFRFRMPILASGEYSIDIALSEGSQTDHIVHQWQVQAIIFKSHSSSLSTGLVGIPMLKVDINKLETVDTENLP
jgi:lipopolysaccharide transport system ATP-binding protein